MRPPAVCSVCDIAELEVALVAIDDRMIEVRRCPLCDRPRRPQCQGCGTELRTPGWCATCASEAA